MDTVTMRHDPTGFGPTERVQFLLTVRGSMEFVRNEDYVPPITFDNEWRERSNKLNSSLG